MGWTAVLIFSFMLGVGPLVAAPAGDTPPGTKTPKIGILRPGLPLDPYVTYLMQGLRDLGYVEGENISIEYRWAHGRTDRLPVLARELARADVDLVVVGGTVATRAVQQATSTIPIVMAAVGDPVRSRFVQSLGRPGGNITGVTLLQSGLGEKRLTLLTQIVPTARRIGVLRNPESLSEIGGLWHESETTARHLGVELVVVEARSAGELDHAFANLERSGVDALLVFPDPVFTTLRGRIAALAAKHRVPAMYEAKEFVVAGGLMSYAASVADQFRRAAMFVDQILKGAKPATLPVEQPSKFELVLNTRAAKALRLTIPDAMLRQVNETVQ